MALAAKPRYTAEEYLARERTAEYKSEYINGEIFAMSGASREHNLISVNLLRELSAQLLDRACEVYGIDMRVKVNATGMHTYPDVVAVCGEPVFEDSQVDTLTNPTAIIEVLSPSTEAYDRGDKFAHYRRLASLQEYVLVAQDKMRVEHYERRGAEWVLTEVNEPDASLNLVSLGCSVALEEVHRRVAPFAEAAPEGQSEEPNV